MAVTLSPYSTNQNNTRPYTEANSDDLQSDFGAGMAFLSGAEMSMTMDNPGAVLFRSAMYGAADLYASIRPEGGTLTGDTEDYIASTEGRISREDFERVIVPQHPGMVGKWRPSMSWFTAQGMADDLNKRERGAVFQDSHEGAALSGGFVGGFADPTNFIIPEAKLAGVGFGKGLVKSAKYGFAAGALTEAVTAPLQNYYLREERTVADALFNVVGSTALPPALFSLERGFSKVKGARVNAQIRKDDFMRLSLGKGVEDTRVTANVQENAINAAANTRPTPPPAPVDEVLRASDAASHESILTASKLVEARKAANEKLRSAVDGAGKAPDPKRGSSAFVEGSGGKEDINKGFNQELISKASDEQLRKAIDHRASKFAEVVARTGSEDAAMNDSFGSLLIDEMERAGDELARRKLERSGKADTMPASPRKGTPPIEGESAGMMDRYLAEDRLRRGEYLRDRSAASVSVNTLEGKVGLDYSTTITDARPIKVADGKVSVRDSAGVRPVHESITRDINTGAQSHVNIADPRAELSYSFDPNNHDIIATRTLGDVSAKVSEELPKTNTKQARRQLEQNRIRKERLASMESKRARHDARARVATYGWSAEARALSLDSQTYIASLRSGGRDAAKAPKSLTELGSRAANWIEFLQSYLKDRGREIRFYDHKNPEALTHFGKGRGAAHFSDSNVVYIATDQLTSFRSLAKVVGHEVGHTILFNSPTEWKRLIDSLVTSNDPALRKLLRETLDDFRDSSAFNLMSAQKKLDETFANVIGQAFESRQFWESYKARYGASAFERFSEWVARFYENILGSLRRRDPESERFLRSQFANIEKAIKETSARKADAVDSAAVLAETRESIHNEYGRRWHKLAIGTMTPEEIRLARLTDEAVDDIMWELPDEAGDPGRTVPKIGGSEFVHFKDLPINPRLSSTLAGLSPRERLDTIQGIILGYQPLIKHLEELRKARSEAMSSVAELGYHPDYPGSTRGRKVQDGDPGRPMVVYSLKKDHVSVSIGYPDTHNPLRWESGSGIEFSRTKTLINSWFQEFTDAAASVSKGQAVGEESQAAAKALHDIKTAATEIMFKGVNDWREQKLGVDVHPLISEFVDSPEFRGMFDLIGTKPVSKKSVAGAGGETARTLDATHNLFFDALDAFISRRKNEEIELRSQLPDKYAAWQDHVKSERATSGQFVAADMAAARKEPVDPSLRKLEDIPVPASEVGFENHTPEQKQAVLNRVVEAFHAIYAKVRDGAEVSDKIGQSVNGMPSLVQAELLFAHDTLQQFKDKGIRFSGTVEDVLQLRSREQMGFHWSSLLDEMRDGVTGRRTIIDKLVEFYAAGIPDTATHREIHIYDNLAYDLMREVNFENAAQKTKFENAWTALKASDKYIRTDSSGKTSWDIQDAFDERVLTDEGREQMQRFFSKFDLEAKHTVEGVTHTAREHIAFSRMRDIIGEREFNRWVLFDNDRKMSFDPETRSTYARRKIESQQALESNRMIPEGMRESVDPASQSRFEVDDGDYDVAQALWERENSNADSNPVAAYKQASEADTMPRADEDLSRFSQRNAEQTDELLKPYLDMEPSKLKAHADEIYARAQSFLGSDSESIPSELLAPLDTALFHAKALEDSAKNFTKAVKGFPPGLISDVVRKQPGVIHPELKSAALYLALEHRSFDDFAAALERRASIESSRRVIAAARDFEAVARQRTNASIEQLYTNIDGQIRVAPDTVKRGALGTVAKGAKDAVVVQAKGQYLTTGVSLEQRFKLAKATATVGLHQALDRIPRPFGGGAQEMAGILKAAIRSVFGDANQGIDQGLRPLISDLGKQLDRSREVVRGMLNKAGAVVEKNPNFFFSLQHSLPSIRKDFNAWADFLKNHIDWDSTFKKVGIDPTSFKSYSEFEFARDNFIKSVYSDLELSARNVETKPWDPHIDDLSKRDTFHRVFDFKDTDAMVDYDMKFGSGDTMTSVINQLDKRAERAVLIDEWGPSYNKNFDHVVGLIEAGREKGGKLQEKLHDMQISRLHTVFKYATGELNNPVNQTVAAIQQSIAAIGNLAFSWMSVPSSLTDVAHLKNALGSVGAGYRTVMAKYLHGMATGSSAYSDAVKAVFHDNLAGLEAIISSTVRDERGFGTPGWAGALNDKIFTANGQKRHTNTLQYMFADLMSHHMGSMAEAVMKGGEVSDEFGRFLDAYQIGRDEFKAMAKDMEHLSIRIDGEKRPVLLPSMISDPALRRRMMAAFKDTMDHAILQPSLSDKALLTFGTRSGTAMGSIVRLVTQYKSFTMAMNRRVTRRMRMYGLSDKAIHGLQLHRFYTAANLLAAGMLASQLKDILAGKEPLTFATEDQRTFNNLHRVVLSAGMFTVMGDLGLEIGVDRKGDLNFDLGTKALGPVPGQALRLAGQMASDDPNSRHRAMRTVLNTTPGATLPFHNLVHLAWGAVFSSAYENYTEALMRHMETLTGQDQNFFDGK